MYKKKKKTEKTPGVRRDGPGGGAGTSKGANSTGVKGWGGNQRKGESGGWGAVNSQNFS